MDNPVVMQRGQQEASSLVGKSDLHRIHIALAAVMSLSVDPSSLTSLKNIFASCWGLSVEVLQESNVLELLLQSLQLAASTCNSNRPNADTHANARIGASAAAGFDATDAFNLDAADRVEIIVDLLLHVSVSRRGSDFLLQSRALERLTALLSSGCLASSGPRGASSVLDFVRRAVRLLPPETEAATKHAALANLLVYWQREHHTQLRLLEQRLERQQQRQQQQQENEERKFAQELEQELQQEQQELNARLIKRHSELCRTVAALCAPSSAQNGDGHGSGGRGSDGHGGGHNSGTLPRYADVHSFVPLMRAVLRSQQTPDSVRDVVYMSLLAVFKCGSSRGSSSSGYHSSESISASDACAGDPSADDISAGDVSIGDSISCGGDRHSCSSDSGKDSNDSNSRSDFRSDIADFAVSADFDSLLLRSDNNASFQLQRFMALMDHATLARAFTAERLARIHAHARAAGFAQQQQSDLYYFGGYAGALATMTAHFPAFGRQFAASEGLAQVLRDTDSKISTMYQRVVVHVPQNTAHLLDALLSASEVDHDADKNANRNADADADSNAVADADQGYDVHKVIAAPVAPVTRIVRQLLEAGAVECCCTMLRFLVLWSAEKHNMAGQIARGQDAAATLLRVLRAMIAKGDTVVESQGDTATNELAPSDSATLATGRNSTVNPVAARFVAARGPQLVELLRYADCTQDGNGTVLGELTQLRSLLAQLGVSDADTLVTNSNGLLDSAATDDDVRRAVAEARKCPQPSVRYWRCVFGAHITAGLAADTTD